MQNTVGLVYCDIKFCWYAVIVYSDFLMHTHNTGSQGQRVLLITVPNFDLTHSCVLVNLTTLECQQLVFSTTFEREHNPELEKLREMQLSEGETAGSGQLESEMSILHHMDMEEEEED